MEIKKELDCIDKLFSGSFNYIYRIPPYQRGFAWESKQVEEFISDVINLKERRKSDNKKTHYSGMISVEETDIDRFSDVDFYKSENYTGYWIIDGQQRMTLIQIFLAIFLNKFKTVYDNDDVPESYRTKSKITQYLSIEHKSIISIKFGYMESAQNYELLRNIFLTGRYDTDPKNKGNIYAGRIANAYEKLERWISNTPDKEKKALFEAVVLGLKFDFKVYEKDAVEEIYIVFETTNRRGKQLTKLELLKNRLLYLSTLKTDVKTQSKFKDLIPKVWNTIYEFLGMFPESPISLDDKFLMDHWTMYQRHLREKEFYAEDLLNRYFTSVNYLEGKTIKEFRNVKINQDELEYYVKDLEESIENWFNMQNPVNGVPDHQDDLYNKSITYYLYKLNQFNSSLFNPMILSLLNLQKKGELKEDEIVNALKEIERYNFMLFSISDLKSDTGSSKFFKSANLLYNSYNRRTEISDLYTVSNFIDEIQKEIFKSLNFYHLHAQMMNLAGNTKSEGFFHWKGSKYLLLEYEEKESKKSGIKKNQYESGQYKLYKIFPYFKKHTYEFNQNPEKLSEAWDASFKKYDESEKLKLASSLGNIVILPEGEKINPEMSYDAIRNVFKKSRMKTVRDIASKYEKWNANAILKRGLELLNFIETNWIPQEYHKKIDFNPELKQRILYFEKFKIKD